MLGLLLELFVVADATEALYLLLALRLLLGGRVGELGLGGWLTLGPMLMFGVKALMFLFFLKSLTGSSPFML
jgi:hypothetical protein